MKQHQTTLTLGILCVIFSVAILCCKKDATPEQPRLIRYILYTKQDFSAEHDTIRFRIYMATKAKTLFDSGIVPMTISAVPDQQHQLVFEKKVPFGYEKEKLKVGFIYDIDNVGESWYLDSCLVGEATKTVEYSFK
ncbi:hypothetical protein [Puia sp.]|jgi:hypothetical protein|uniref:hypothetical protein n=1 Tax=Puia sp. TaxID=2045100 RepID=UPI002F40B6EB